MIGWERVEPANESGFPDTHFVLKDPNAPQREGTVEFKWSGEPGMPNLASALVRGNQKAALIEYVQMGGNRRFFLCYSRGGEAWLYNTQAAYQAVLGKSGGATALSNLEEPAFPSWLRQLLSMNHA